MSIPVPLAFPPTALRNIGAGGIVGNEIGSSGTRGKVLSSAQLKAIVEASGISYLPLAGGTLTGPIVANADIALMFTKRLFVSNGDTSGNYLLAGATAGLVSNTVAQAGWNTNGFFARRLILDYANADVILERGGNGILEQRNGLTAQCFDLFETYTSGTNNGKLRFKATSSGHQIGSARASSGSNRAVQLGHFNALDVFTSGLSVADNGVVSAGSVNYADGTIDARTSGNHALTLRATGAANAIRVLDGSGVTKWSVDSTGSMTIGTLGYLSFPHSTTVGDPNQVIIGGGAGLGLRTSGSVFIATGGPAATFVVDAAGKVTSTSQMIHVPPTSTITLGVNGQFSLEMTSNTAGNLVYRGSDGTTRRMALTFS